MRQAALALLLSFGFALSCLGQVTRDCTLRVDAVELLDRAHEVEGRADIEVERDRFTYLFSTEANKAAFLSNPEKYEIQMGGACARMGPLSGGGTPRLYAVHDGKIYILASESCRMAFLASPEKFIGVVDPVPETSEESRARGRALLGKAVDAIACLAFIDTLKTYREALERDEKSNDRTWQVTESITLMRPDKVRSDTCWIDICFGFVADGKDGWFVEDEGVRPMAPVQRQALVDGEGRHVLSILWARDDKNMIIAANGERRIIDIPNEGQIDLELVTVHRDGATTILGLDDAHRVRLMSFRGRGPNATFGQVERIYGNFRDVGGLKLPGAVIVTFDGELVAKQSGEFTEQAVNDPDDADRFVRHVSNMKEATNDD
jgi:YHS domain-containing protein